MKEEKEIISEYFNNYYPQKRTIVLNEVGPFAPMGAGVVGGTAGEVAGTLSSGATGLGTIIGFGGLAIIALIIFFLIRGTKQDYGYVTGNVRDPGTYREMTSTLDTMINGKISPEDKEALQNYKQDLNDFQKEDQKILTLLKQLSGIKQEGFDKKTIDGIGNLSDILLKIGEKKQTADQEIKIRNIVIQIQTDNKDKPVLQKICGDILDSLKSKEEIIKRSTGYQKLILKLSTKFPKLSDTVLSKLMFGTGKEDSLDLIKKARELESNKKKQTEFLKKQQIPFQIEKIDDETGIKIKIAYDDNKIAGLLKIIKDDKIEIQFTDSSLDKKFKEQDLIIKNGQEFLLSFLDLENEYTVFYEDFLNKFNGEIAEIKNFEVSEENLPKLKSIIKTYIDPTFLDTIKEYSKSSKETKNKDINFEEQLDEQIKNLAKKVVEFYQNKIDELDKINDPNPFILSKKIRISYKKILILKKSILYSTKGDIQEKHDKYFEKIIEITNDVKSILKIKLKSIKESLNKNTVQQDTQNSLEELKKENGKLYDDLIGKLNPILTDHQDQIKKIKKSLDSVIDFLQNSNSVNDLELEEGLMNLSDLLEENQDNEEEIKIFLSEEEPPSLEEEPLEKEDKRPLIQKLKDLQEKKDVIEIKQDITLDIKNKKFKSADSESDSYIKFLKKGDLQIYSKGDLKVLKDFNKGFVFESKDDYKLVFKGKYKIESPKKGQKEGKINIYKITPVEDVKDLETDNKTPVEDVKDSETDNKITDDQILEISKKLKLTAFTDSEYIKIYSKRYIVLKEFNNFLVPFYLSTGLGGKDNVSSKKWYPYLGNSENGYFWKSNSQKNINEKYGIKELQNFSKELDDNFGDLIKKENKIKEIDLKDLIENTNKSFKKDNNLIERITSLYKAFGFKDEEIDKLINNFLKTDLVDNIKGLKGEKSVIALDIILNDDGSFTESSDVTDYKIIFKQDRTYVIRSKNKESDESKFKKIIDSIFESKIEENFEKEYPNVIYAGNYEIKGTKVIIKSSQLIESGFQKEKKDNSDIKNIPETENEIFKITNLSKFPLFYKDKEYKNGESFNIKKEKISVGRSENNDIVFKEKIVSEFHAVIELNSDKTSFKVIDNNSTNGTQYKQKAIESPQSFDSATDISFSLDFPIKIEVLESAKLESQSNYEKLFEKSLSILKDLEKIKKESGLNITQKRLLNLIEHRFTLKLKKEEQKNEKLSEIILEISTLCLELESNGSDIKRLSNDEVKKLDEFILKISDIKQIKPEEVENGKPKDLEEKDDEPPAQSKPPTFSDGLKWSLKDLYNLLVNNQDESGQKITWGLFSSYIEINDKKITLFKSDEKKDKKDFYIAIRKEGSNNEGFPFEILKKEKDKDVDFSEEYSYQEAFFKELKNKYYSFVDKIYNVKDIIVYTGIINIKEDGISFSEVKKSEEEKEKTPSFSGQFKITNLSKYPFNLGDQIIEPQKFINTDISKDGLSFLINSKLNAKDVINFKSEDENVTGEYVTIKQNGDNFIIKKENENEAKDTTLDGKTFEKEFVFEKDTVVLNLIKDYKVKIEKIIKTEEQDKEQEKSIITKAKETTLKGVEKLYNLFIYKDPKTSEEKREEIQKSMPDVIPEPDTIDMDVVEKIKNEINVKNPLELSSQFYGLDENLDQKQIKQLDKNKKIEHLFQEIFIKEIKKEFFYNEQEGIEKIEKEKEVAEIKTQDDLMDYLFPSNVYKIDLDVGNKIQQENNFSEDALEKIKNGIIFYKRKDENFYRGQLKISDLSIFHKNEDLLKTYFNFYKNSEKIKNVLSEESKKLVEDIKHPDIMSGNYCQVQIDAVTSFINNEITTNYKITVLKKGIVSSDKFTEKFKTIDKEKEKDLISKLKDVVKKDLEEKQEEKPEEINQKEEIVPPKEEVLSEQYFISLDDIKNKKKKVSDVVSSDIGIIFTKNKQNFTGYLWIKQLNKVDELISFNEIIALRDYFNFNLQDFIINEEININDYKSGFISDNSLTVTIVNNEITSVINKGNVKNEYYTRLETSKQELLKTEIEKTNKEAAYKKFGLTDLLIREKAQEQITESPTGFIAKKESSKEGILIPKNYKNIDIMLSKDGYKVYYYIKNGEDYYYIDVNEKLFYILNVIIRGLKFFFGASNTLITVDKEIANSEIKLKDLKTILKVTKVAQDKNIKKMKFKFGKIEQKITKGNKTFFKFPLNTSMQPKISDGKEQGQGNQTAVPQTEEFFENLIIKNIWKK